MFSFSMPELMVILVIALIVFGPGKLPDVGKAIGKGLQEFRRASNDVMNPKEEPINIEAKATTEIKQPEEKK